ncbi:MarR family transcriptional regulator [Streptomyces telluris]|uniref:MarR family transcriptional regulator n=2 Tax=Streptomyces TaxID=1883 RepID=A0A9X2LGZ0_9ACTN|nr:MarR family transcriptional regulator [Streptomyces telluris]MCQ8769685.1 MarR family transcriptional regulator [Streptomyces telluris]
MHAHSGRVRGQWAANNPGLDTSSMEIVTLIKRCASLLDRAVEPLVEGAPLTLQELDFLVPLRYEEEPVIARRLAEDLGLTQAAVSKALAKLERRGLIERAPNPADRRASLVTITEEGKRLMDSLFPRRLTVEAEMFHALGGARAEVLEALERLAEVMGDHVEKTAGDRRR